MANSTITTNLTQLLHWSIRRGRREWRHWHCMNFCISSNGGSVNSSSMRIRTAPNPASSSIISYTELLDICVLTLIPPPPFECHLRCPVPLACALAWAASCCTLVIIELEEEVVATIGCVAFILPPNAALTLQDRYHWVCGIHTTTKCSVDLARSISTESRLMLLLRAARERWTIWGWGRRGGVTRRSGGISARPQAAAHMRNWCRRMKEYGCRAIYSHTTK